MSGCPSRYLRPVLKDARGWCLRGVRFLRRASASAAAAARARRAIGRAFSAFVCGVTRVPPPLGVRCALFSVFVGVGRVSSALIKLTCFWWGFAGLRLRASPSGFAFGLRLRASPSGFAFGLRLRASPSGFAFGPARRHDSTQNPWMVPVVVRACPTKHPRHTAVVFTTKRRRRAVFWRASCCICCDRPRPHTESGCPSVALLIRNSQVKRVLRDCLGNLARLRETRSKAHRSLKAVSSSTRQRDGYAGSRSGSAPLHHSHALRRHARARSPGTLKPADGDATTIRDARVTISSSRGLRNHLPGATRVAVSPGGLVSFR